MCFRIKCKRNLLEASVGDGELLRRRRWRALLWWSVHFERGMCLGEVFAMVPDLLRRVLVVRELFVTF